MKLSGIKINNLNIDENKISLEELNSILNELLESEAFQALMEAKNVIKEVYAQIPSSIRGTIEPFIDFLTNINNILLLIKEADSYEPNINRIFETILDTINKDLKVLNSIFLVMGATSLAANVAFIAVSSVAAFGSAAVFWALTAHASYELSKATILMSSPSLQVNQFKKRYIKANAQLKKLEEKLATVENKINKNKNHDSKSYHYLQNKMHQLKTKVEKLVIRQERFKYITLHLAEKNPQDKSLKKSIKEFQTVTKLESSHRFANEFRSTPIDLNKSLTENGLVFSDKLMAELKQDQKDLIVQKTVNVVGYAISAVGATLLAVSPFCAAGTPAVAGVGIALGILGSAVLVANKAIPKIHNFIAKKMLYANLRKEYLASPAAQEFLAISNQNPAFAALNTQKKLQCYYLARAENISADEILDTYDKKDLLKKFKKMEIDIRKEFDQQILCKALDTDDAAALKLVSNKTKQNIVDRHCRRYMQEVIKNKIKNGVNALKQSASSLFTDAKELSISQLSLLGKKTSLKHLPDQLVFRPQLPPNKK